MLYLLFVLAGCRLVLAIQYYTTSRLQVDIKMALFDVLKFIMLDNWKHFFPIGQVQQAAGGGAAAGQVQHEEQFLAFIQAFGASFAQPELELFRANLQAIVTINSQKKLFERQVRQLRRRFSPFITLFAAPCDGLFSVPLLIRCYALLAIRWHARFTSSGLPRESLRRLC